MVQVISIDEQLVGGTFVLDPCAPGGPIAERSDPSSPGPGLAFCGFLGFPPGLGDRNALHGSPVSASLSAACSSSVGQPAPSSSLQPDSALAQTLGRERDPRTPHDDDEQPVLDKIKNKDRNQSRKERDLRTPRDEERRREPADVDEVRVDREQRRVAQPAGVVDARVWSPS